MGRATALAIALILAAAIWLFGLKIVAIVVGTIILAICCLCALVALLICFALMDGAS